MQAHLKKYVVVGLLVVGGWFSWRTYHYFFDTSSPLVTIRGMEPEGSYAGNIQCVLSGSDGYKVADISIYLDNAPLVNKFRINRHEFDHPFTINSQALSNGKHVLTVEAVNGTYRRNKAVLEQVFYVDNLPLQAAFVRPDSDLKVFQGRTLHLQFQTNKEIKTAQVKAISKIYDCFPESAHSSVYETFIPISCEENPNEYLLSIDVVDKVGNKQALESKFQVIAYPFKKQTLAFNQQALIKEVESGLKQQELKNQLEAITVQSPKEKKWHGAFCVPVDMTTVTCDFGTVRTTREKGRYAHNAVDLGARPKSVVWAAQNGTVALRERYAQTGNTVVIDHGYGVCTMYCHLDSFADVKVGDRIEKGNPLGIMGKTGFATGEHLHWELLVNNIQVDPLQWTKHNF